MDEARTKRQVHDHADAVVRGDMDTVIGDFSEELRPQAPEITKSLPQPVTAAEVVSLDIGDDESVAEIRYSNDDTAMTVRTRWQEIDGRPTIVHGEPVS
jgi:hypothetical protein